MMNDVLQWLKIGGGTSHYTEKGGQALTCSPFRLPKKGGLRCKG